MSKHESINYVEYPASDITPTKMFFQNVFGWSFQDYGDEYTSFSAGNIDGGFYKSESCSLTENGGALVIFYSQDIESTKTKIEENGGIIVKPIFSFPGGRRFHFTEPSGNEFAVWTDN